MAYKQKIELNGNQGYYFPLFNQQGFRSSISPFMAGDCKLDQHHFALEPISELDLYLHGLGRNIIFDVDGQLLYLNGMTTEQQNDRIELIVDLLYQEVIRTQSLYQITTTSYVAINDPIEVHRVIYQNLSGKNQTIKITTAIPLYARSADNIRDHRHVTSLLNRISCDRGIVSVKPTMQFDERGHQKNQTSYHVLADSQLKVNGYIPTIDQLINGGNLSFPKGLNHIVSAPYHMDGYEALGGIQFESVTLKPNESVMLYYGIAITKDENVNTLKHNFLNHQGFEKGLKEVKDAFESYANKLQFQIGNQAISDRANWMVLQPLLRRYYGNSFLPHHDYGKGGKGWRDLWQDLLSLIMMGDTNTKDMLASNFLGVRLDGSNATIIGEKPGEFIADRNKIVRVWSDHGAWPLLTVKQYIDETGDVDFLWQKSAYFHDQFTHYTHQRRQDVPKISYEGTILEHLLLQNLVGFLHQGKHGFTKLEDADWNDGNDMAKIHGETIAFTHLYTKNLRSLASLIEKSGQTNIIVFKALASLLMGQVSLHDFFDQVTAFDEETISLSAIDVIKQLQTLADKMTKKLHTMFMDDRYQSYYDEKGLLFDQENTANLTGQAMALLSLTPSNEQANKLAKRIKQLLFEPSIGGYHLNSRYDHASMGRAYGFAYNHKENGAIFSHMNIMYAYGLYQYDLVQYGHEAAFTLIEQALKPNSGVLLGIPEYFTELGVGKYSYLTGSASWFLKLLRDEVFGLSFDLGVLTLKPKLLSKDFIHHEASIETIIFGQKVKITYYNPKGLDYGNYQINKIIVDGNTASNEFKTIGKRVEVYLDEML